MFQLGNSESLFVKMIKFLPSSNCLIKDFVENDLKCFPSAGGREMIIKYFVIVLILRSKGDGSNFNYMKTLTREKSRVRVSI